MTVIWTDKVDSKFLRRYWLAALVVLVVVGGALAALIGAQRDPSPSDRCVAKLAAIAPHDVILGSPVVEHLPGGDVQVNGRFYDPRADVDRSFLCTVHGSSVDLEAT